MKIKELNKCLELVNKFNDEYDSHGHSYFHLKTHTYVSDGTIVLIVYFLFLPTIQLEELFYFAKENKLTLYISANHHGMYFSLN